MPPRLGLAALAPLLALVLTSPFAAACDPPSPSFGFARSPLFHLSGNGDSALAWKNESIGRWDVRSGAFEPLWRTNAPPAAALSPDARWLAFIAWDTTWRRGCVAGLNAGTYLADLRTNEIVRALDEPTMLVRADRGWISLDFENRSLDLHPWGETRTVANLSIQSVIDAVPEFVRNFSAYQPEPDSLRQIAVAPGDGHLALVLNHTLLLAELDAVNWTVTDASWAHYPERDPIASLRWSLDGRWLAVSTNVAGRFSETSLHGAHLAERGEQSFVVSVRHVGTVQDAAWDHSGLALLLRDVSGETRLVVYPKAPALEDPVVAVLDGGTAFLADPGTRGFLVRESGGFRLVDPFAAETAAEEPQPSTSPPVTRPMPAPSVLTMMAALVASMAIARRRRP